MSLRISGNSDLYFEGEGRYSYYGKDPEHINTKSTKRIKTTLEFKKTAFENLQILIKLPISFFNTTQLCSFFYVDLLAKSITSENPIELTKIKISAFKFQIINWKIRVEGLIEYQKEPDSNPIEFRLNTEFLLKSEIDFNRNTFSCLDGRLRAID
jgi:hypothetical protein